MPYFKYLLDGCVHHLTNTEDALIGLTQKKKKLKVQAGNSEKKYVNRRLTLEDWHIRALILSSLHKCFLYDTGNLKFLDSSNFQASIFLYFRARIIICMLPFALFFTYIYNCQELGILAWE